jgi:protein-disulfide isomerase
VTQVNKKPIKNENGLSNKQIWIYGSTFLVAIILVAVLIGFGGKKEDKTTVSPSPIANTKGIYLDYDNRPVLGNKDALVSIAEYADFKCPACKIWHDRILPQLTKDFITNGKAKLYFFNFPIISEDSITAMSAARSIYFQNPDAFWVFYDKIYEKQQAEGIKWATNSFLTNFTKDNVPNVDSFKVSQDIKNDTYKNDIQKDYEQGVLNDVKSTPTIFINGKKLINPFDYNEITTAINQVK